MSKKTVSVVCPECRRPYVLSLDLAAVRRSRSRALCSRCGARFEILPRLVDVDGEDAAPAAGPAAARPADPPAARPRGAEVVQDETPEELPYMDYARRSSVGGRRPTQRAARQPSPPAPVPPPVPAEQTVAEQVTDEPRPALAQPVRLSRIPAPVADLDRPFSWFEGEALSLADIVPVYATGAATIEWLVRERCERPRQTRPPPIPLDARVNGPSRSSS